MGDRARYVAARRNGPDERRMEEIHRTSLLVLEDFVVLYDLPITPDSSVHFVVEKTLQLTGGLHGEGYVLRRFPLQDSLHAHPLGEHCHCLPRDRELEAWRLGGAGCHIGKPPFAGGIRARCIAWTSLKNTLGKEIPLKAAIIDANSRLTLQRTARK
ncbi:hypothetical protein DFH06DRAFT_1251677 [Mycena polygramma]|nr:hypothetical protein DFH06DRAFT_1251677 [Mycena polygramma]